VPSPTADRIGARIASYRKLSNLTQREFADLSHLSLGGVRKVERGERLPTHGFLIAAARVLNISVQELSGQPFRGDRHEDERVHAPIAGIRAAARHYDLPGDWFTRPRPLHELARDIKEAAEHRAAAHYTLLGGVLPGLMEELTAAVHTHEDREQRYAARLLSSAYYMAHSLSYRLGYPDLTSQLEDRLRWSARLTDDPLMMALAEWTRSYSYDAAGEYHAGLRLLTAARDQLREAVREDTPQLVTVLGSFHLRESTFSALAQDEDTTEHHIAAAGRLAEGVTTGDRRFYHLTFGPANVGVHAVAAQVEMKRPETAVKAARRLRLPGGMARTRQGHHHVAVARAFLDLDRRDEALHSLQRARKAAPEQTRYHPMARETARALTTKYRRTTEELRTLTTWLGVRE
jgi:transcriptional regulator with XRE-family HTH domain